MQAFEVAAATVVEAIMPVDDTEDAVLEDTDPAPVVTGGLLVELDEQAAVIVTSSHATAKGASHLQARAPEPEDVMIAVSTTNATEPSIPSVALAM